MRNTIRKRWLCFVYLVFILVYRSIANTYCGDVVQPSADLYAWHLQTQQLHSQIGVLRNVNKACKLVSVLLVFRMTCCIIAVTH
jgi:hypothetical protein